jgi:hypothetical protein
MGGAEKTQQIVLKTENLNKELHEAHIVAFAETVNLDNDSTSTEELWNWIKKVCQKCPHDSSEGLHVHKEQPLGSSEIQVQPMDEDKLKWIQEYHNTPVAGRPGRAKTYDQLSRSHCWTQMRKDVN